jgi:rod shape-determining protein MreD
MVQIKARNAWVIWASLVLALLLSIAPMPFSDEPTLRFLEIGRPLWPALFLSYWVLALPHRVGMVGAWCLGLVLDVLTGALLGQNALILTLTIFLVLSLQRRLQMFPMWQQSLVLLVVFGLAQLVQLWLNALTGNRPPTLAFVLPALISALLWPWVFAILRGLQQRFAIR